MSQLWGNYLESIAANQIQQHLELSATFLHHQDLHQLHQIFEMHQHYLL
jgi:hypothetical protein